MTKFSLTLCVLLLGLLSTLAFFLFRSVVIDNPALGMLTIQYSWGRPEKVQVDSNRDGIIDGRYILSSDAKYFSPHSRYVEAWESAGCNGILDLHLRFDPAGGLETLEFDSDHNQSYEVILHGSEATHFLRSLQRPRRCGRLQGAVE